jgi:acetylornithine deacetylase/succinyl-diaminopimelate desuccinylase-like protein
MRHGLAAEILETGGNPLVYGALNVPGATRTILFYCHYDGQPVDPKAWKQPDPFTPVLRRGRMEDQPATADPKSVTRYDPEWRIYARSASDDKAPIVALLAAVDALKASGFAPSSNVHLILDGEEEDSSPSLVPAIAQYKDKLRADLMVILDGPVHSSGRPTVVYGARGIATVDLTVFGPRSGVHSGNYGNWMPNPAMRLAALLASMKDEDGKVKVAGYYDAVAPLTPAERAMLDAVPEDTERMLRTFGVAAPEKAFPKLQDAMQVPTLNIRGLASAFVGPNARTIVPDRATAAIDIRLVKETSPADLVAKLRAHVEKQGYHLVESDPDDLTRAQYGRLARLSVVGQMISAFRTSTSDPQARGGRRGDEGVRPAAGSAADAWWHGADRPFIEALGFPRCSSRPSISTTTSTRRTRTSASAPFSTASSDRRHHPSVIAFLTCAYRLITLAAHRRRS